MPDKRSVLTLQLMDPTSQAAGTGPLRGNPYDGFSFLLNGNPIVVRSSAINTARTYPDLRFAIEAAVNALKPTNAALANLAVTLGPDFARFDTRSGLPVVGQSILLTDRSGGILTQNPNAGWQLLVGGGIPVDSFYRTIIDSSEVSP